MNPEALPFLDLLAGRSDLIELDDAALHLAALDNPDLDREAVLETLDEWAQRIAARLPPAAGGAQYLSAAHEVLFEELALNGDTDDYFAPANSCLDQVIARRRGLPLTLSVIYIEIARRLLRPVFGIPLPAHFLCQFNDGLVNVFVDPFHGGNLLTRDGCLDLVEEITGRRPPESPLLFAPATKRQMLLRMLNNLRNAYLRAGRPEDAERVENVLLEAQKRAKSI